MVCRTFARTRREPAPAAPFTWDSDSGRDRLVDGGRLICRHDLQRALFTLKAHQDLAGTPQSLISLEEEFGITIIRKLHHCLLAFERPLILCNDFREHFRD